MALLALASALSPPRLDMRLTASPARPEPGSIVRLTITGAGSGGDSVVSVRGTMSGEPLHFVRVGAGVWHAIGAVPVDAVGSVLARAVVQRTSGAADSLRVAVVVPRIPPPRAEPLAVDTGFTQQLDSATELRIARENARARAVGR